MNMFDEKAPPQKSVKTGSSDDDVIIDLTDEVVVKTEDDNNILELAEEMADDAPQAVEDDQTSEVEEDEEIRTLDETDNLSSQGDDAITDLSDQAEEDQLIASAMAASLEADEDEAPEVTQQFDLNAIDDDEAPEVTRQFDLNAIDEDEAPEVTQQFDLNATDEDEALEVTRQFDLNATDEEEIIIVDNTRDEADEDVFDLEEEIELEYESDEDEDEDLELDDERAEDNQDFVDLMLGISKEPDQDGNDEEQAEYFEFETHRRDDIIVLDTNRDPDKEVIALAEDAAPDFADGDDLPDLEDISEFDFDSEEDAEDSPVIDQLEPDSSDDIIARTVDQSSGSGDDREQVDLADEAEFGFEDNDDILDLDGTRDNDDDDEILALADDELINFENDEDLLDLDEGADLEDDYEVIPLDGVNDVNAEHDDEIIEITEFDQHFPSEGEALLNQSGILDTAGSDEEDFLELLDIEEDNLSDDEGDFGFNDSTEKFEIDRLNQFFSDDPEDDQPESLTPESIFEDFSEKKSGLDDEAIEFAEQTPDMNAESTTDDEISIWEDEKFEFNFDPDSIAQQIDRLDTFLPEDSADEPAVASFPVNQVTAEEEATGPEEPSAGQGIGELPAVPPGQIDAAIERVITEKFSDRIENIIYEVIEKAVAKEIDRLKGVLVGNITSDDDQP